MDLKEFEKKLEPFKDAIAKHEAQVERPDPTPINEEGMPKFLAMLGEELMAYNGRLLSVNVRQGLNQKAGTNEEGEATLEYEYNGTATITLVIDGGQRDSVNGAWVTQEPQKGEASDGDSAGDVGTDGDEAGAEAANEEGDEGDQVGGGEGD